MIISMYNLFFHFTSCPKNGLIKLCIHWDNELIQFRPKKKQKEKVKIENGKKHPKFTSSIESKTKKENRPNKKVKKNKRCEAHVPSSYPAKLWMRQFVATHSTNMTAMKRPISTTTSVSIVLFLISYFQNVFVKSVCVSGACRWNLVNHFIWNVCVHFRQQNYRQRYREENWIWSSHTNIGQTGFVLSRSRSAPSAQRSMWIFENIFLFLFFYVFRFWVYIGTLLWSENKQFLICNLEIVIWI